MNLSIRLVLAALCIAMISACKKKKKEAAFEEPASPVMPSYPSYSQLKVGNYWIYQRFSINPKTGIVTKTNAQDSCYVMKDTLISNKTFYKLRKFDFAFNSVVYLFLRDSLHCIVNEKGKVLFSSEDFTSLFDEQYLIEPILNGDTLYHVTSKMGDKDLVTACPAGTFVTSSMKSTYTVSPKYSPPELRIRTLDSRYSKNIGQITETEPFYAGLDIMFERRLLRYYLN